MEFTLVGVLTLMGPVFFLFVFLEFMYFKKRDRVNEMYSLQDSLTSAELTVMYQVGEVIAGLILTRLYFLVYDIRLFTIPSTLGGFFLLFILQDLLYYWFHRSSHLVRVMWASHVAHHSSQYMNFTVAFRQSLTYNLSGMFLFWLPLPLLGFEPKAVLIMVGLSLSYQFFIHTEVVTKMGVLEWILNTPAHHRVHHNRDPKLMNSNYGGILILWDRMFGTFVEEAPEMVHDYGIPTLIPSTDPLIITFYEWFRMLRDVLRAGSLQERLDHFLGEPDWQYQAPAIPGLPQPRIISVAALGTTSPSVG